MTPRYTHLRPHREASVSVVAVPLDVRLMNLAASLLWVGLAVASVVTCLWLVLALPAFALRGISVQGDVAHNNAVTLRANVVSRLSGNFFTADLARVRQAFENVPWVRRATVQREFPNRLHVTLQEHQPVAHWGEDTAAPRMVNSFGEVFDINAGDLEEDHLPHLSGPDSQAQQVLSMYLTMQPMFKALDLALERLELTQRGSWRAGLAHGAKVELGRGSVAQIKLRMQRMSDTVVQVSHQLGRKVSALESADLRYDNGYALRLRGVSTQETLAPR